VIRASRSARVVLALVAGLAAGCARGPVPGARQGLLDLSSWDFEAGEPLRLRGEWVFRYGSLEGPAALPANGVPAPPFMALPGSWNRQGRPGFGVATHALRILLPDPPPRELAIVLGETHSAARLYVNGRLVVQRGRVSSRAEDELAEPAPLLVRFPVTVPTLDVALDLSNHFHYEGGPVHAPRLGLPEAMQALVDDDTRVDHLILGCLGVLSLYYALLFAARPERSHLLFAVLTAIVVLRVAVMEWHLNRLLPIGAAGQLRLDYFTLFLAPPVYYALLVELFPADFPRSVLRSALAFAGLGVLSLALPTHVFTHMREPGMAAGLAVVTLAFFFVARAARRGREGAALIAVNGLVVVAVAVHDSLARLRLIEESRELLPFANAALIFSHALVLGLRLSGALRESRGLSDRLHELNLDLERRISERTAELERMATTDPLTGLSNRRDLQRLAEVERARAMRHRHDLAVLVVDADHFKRINDTHGHAGGDVVLQVLAKELLTLVRGHDLVGRWGGEEFVLVLPHLDAVGARVAAERVRRRVTELAIALPDGDSARLTVSVGAAVARGEESFERVLRRADRALYAAKATGRNRVAFDDGP
jgi:diguanylate cyclase (GGDEF)-like protein